MPLQVNELGIEFSIEKPVPQSSNDDGCCEDDQAAQKAIEDRLVERVAERVLARLKRMEER